MSNWIQAVGTIDVVNSTGDILGVQSAKVPPDSADIASVATLVSLDVSGNVLASVDVAHDLGSCDDGVTVASFQVYIDLPEATRTLSLRLSGEEIASFSPDTPQPSVAGSAFAAVPQDGHALGLTLSEDAPSNASYILQAREKGKTIWETLDIGLSAPETSSVDLRQFPDAEVVEVRVLKTSGFKEEEVDRHEIDFTN